MVKVKPLSGAHPGFAPLKPHAIASVLTGPTSVKVDKIPVDCTFVKFLDKDGTTFAELNSARNDIAWIQLEAEKGKTIGSFLTETTTLVFPAKGKLSSVPDGRGVQTSDSGRQYERYNIVLSGVKFADLVKQN
jgi:hypothetical protein